MPFPINGHSVLFLNKLLAAALSLWLGQTPEGLEPCEGRSWLSSEGLPEPGTAPGTAVWVVLAMLLDPGAGRRFLPGNMEQTGQLMFNTCSELC